jgi:hypothetical protein
MTQETDKPASEQAPGFFDTVTYTGVGWAIPMPAQNPPRREWVGLTPEEVDSVAPYCHSEFDLAEFKDFASAIEAKLKEKNNG